MKKSNKKSRPNVARSKAHIKTLHRVRLGLFSILLVMLVAVRGNSGMIEAASPAAQQASVLAYSTSMSRGDLLSGTNVFRAQNGLGPLSLNAQLNNAAQSKAQHMVALNYWAHDAPDGTTPWYFFDQAGYSYSKAGENLAYGFNTSQDVVNGWIGSPGHRANILAEYTEVGFGFVDGSSYQGGQYTVVVAHYGTPSAPAPAPVAPAQSVAPASTAPAPVAPPAAAPVAETPTPPVTTTAPETTKDPSGVVPPEITPPISTAATQEVSLLNQLSVGPPPSIAIFSSLLVVSVMAGFALTHRSFVRHAAIAGERFVIAHPLLDGTAVIAVIGLILTTTVGRIG